MHAAGVLFPVCIYTPVLSLVPRPSAADGLGTRRLSNMLQPSPPKHIMLALPQMQLHQPTQPTKCLRLSVLNTQQTRIHTDMQAQDPPAHTNSHHTRTEECTAEETDIRTYLACHRH